MRKKIGVVGAGTAGLHLGLYLRKFGVDVTILTDRQPEEYKNIKLPNTVAHYHVTVEREDELECNHWPLDQYGYHGHYYYVGGQHPVRFYGALAKQSRAVDYRIYHPKLMEDFLLRGGNIEFRQIAHEDLSNLTRRFDLLVVCAGKDPFGKMFHRDPIFSPFDQPQRALCVGIFKGVRETSTRALVISFSPGQGELIEIPIFSYGGMATALYISNHIGSDLGILAKTSYADNPKRFISLLLEKLRKHYPDCAERVDEKEFDLANGPCDILQGGITPTVRKGHVFLDGKLVVALGDAHAVVDPILGQGANMASYAGVTLAEEIVKQNVFDERFMEHFEERRSNRVLSATRWTNYTLDALRSLEPNFLQFIGAMSQDMRIADEFTENFNFPERQWDCFASRERIQDWIESRIKTPETTPLLTTGIS